MTDGLTTLSRLLLYSAVSVGGVGFDLDGQSFNINALFANLVSVDIMRLYFIYACYDKPFIKV